MLHELGAHDAFGEAGIVLDFGRDRELAAGLQSREEHGFEVGAGGVDRCGVAGGAGAQDEHVVQTGHGFPIGMSFD